MVLGLNRPLTTARGSIKLIVEARTDPRQVRLNAEFVVFDSTSPYDSIMGQPLIFSLRAIVSLYHYSLKFPTSHSIGKIKVSREFAKRCQMKVYPSYQNECIPPGVYVVCSSGFDHSSLTRDEN